MSAFEDVLDRIYEAAALPELWPDALALVNQIADVDGGALFVASDEEVRWTATPPLAETMATQIAQGEVPEPDELRQSMMESLEAQRDSEIDRGVNLIGPHRDDLVLSLGELPAKGYASHGESWSFALSLKLGAFALLRADGVEPVLILDDVFAELDQVRRDRLAGMIDAAEQVLITAAVPDDVPAALGGRQFRVGGGQVSEVSDARA